MNKGSKAKAPATKAEKVILPRVMSELIEIALADLAKVRRDRKHYRVDMNTWCEVENGKYTVCAAGAVMVGTLDAHVDSYRSPHADLANVDQLRAIDHLRMGLVYTAANCLGLTLVKDASIRRLIPPYNPRCVSPFTKAMKQLAADLRAVGL